MNPLQTNLPMKPLWSFDEEKDALELVKLLKENGIHVDQQKRGGNIWPKTWVLVGSGQEVQAKYALRSGPETLSRASLELNSLTETVRPRTKRIIKLHHVFSVLFFGLVPVSLVIVRFWGTKKNADSVPELHGLPAVIMFAWLISLAAVTLGVLFTRCPLCGKMFHFRPGIGNPLARKCLRCGYGLSEKNTFT